MDKLPAGQQAAIAKSSSDQLRQTLLTAGEEEATVSTMDRGTLKAGLLGLGLGLGLEA